MRHFFINSIYLATEGEGIFIGLPQVFIRFQGCNVGCLNCDSKETWPKSMGPAKSLGEVIEEVQKAQVGLTIKRYSITGGDPLHAQNRQAVLELIKALKSKGPCLINLEAAGTKIDDEIFDRVDFISFDFKTPSTGVKSLPQNLLHMAQQYSGKFQIKSVVQTQEDFKASLSTFNWLLQELNLSHFQKNFDWCLTPAYNTKEEFPLERFRNVLSWNQEAGAVFRVIGQQHKWVFGPDTKNV